MRRTGTSTFDLQHPAQMPECFEAGTAGTHAICALCAGVRYVQRIGVEQIHRLETELRAYFTRQLRTVPGLILYGDGAESEQYTGTLSVNLRGADPALLGAYLSQNGVCVRTGFHCAPLAHRALGTQRQGGTVRFSLNHLNTRQEIDEVVRLLRRYRGGTGVPAGA